MSDPLILAEPAGAVAMSVWQAVVLGIVEGLTEYLPVSSTGHLLLAQRVLGIAPGTAADAYAICIQAGAILAVLGLYARRIGGIARGLIGRDPAGLRLGLALGVAFMPAALAGLLLEDWIKAHLFGRGDWGLRPIAWAWLVGGVAILLFARRLRGVEAPEAGPRATLETIHWRAALVIGLCQCAAMWPGVSRSLATILGGLLAGLGLLAAVEFSFLLGLITLTASTFYDGLKHGGEMLAVYGWGALLAGLLAALLSAWLAVRWLVGYLQRHPLTLFGWYRLALGAAVLGWCVYAG